MTTDVGKNIDKKELCAAGWNVNSPITRQVTIESTFKKLKIDLFIWPRYITPGYLPLKTICHRNM